MNAKEASLSKTDILKVYGRKFMRLAPAYYSIWLVVYIVTPRVITGPNAYNAAGNMYNCANEWPYVATMTANVLGTSMDQPFSGCYQMSWPIQLDMQITLFIPFIAILLWKNKDAGIVFCLFLIVANWGINYAITIHYNIKIGFMDVHNYFWLQGMISKPWTRVGGVAQGCILAVTYLDILKYRKSKNQAKEFPKLYFMHSKRWVGWLLIATGLITIYINLMCTSPYLSDTHLATSL